MPLYWGLPSFSDLIKSTRITSGFYDRIELIIYSFNVHGVLYVGDDEHIAPVEQEIRDLSSGLQLVKDEQAYLVVRERVHRNSTLNWMAMYTS